MAIVRLPEQKTLGAASRAISADLSSSQIWRVCGAQVLIALSVATAAMLTGCGASAGPSSSVRPVAVAEKGDLAVASSPIPGDPRNQQLANLARERATDAFSPDFLLGPGDSLEISAADVKELADREVSISPDGNIALPVIGVVHVAGLSEEQATRRLRERLARYVKDAELDVTLKKYHEQQVAVVGMVRKPGLYIVRTKSESILDMLERAGGTTVDASTRIVFVPSNGSDKNAAAALAATNQDTERVMPAANSERDNNLDGASKDESEHSGPSGPTAAVQTHGSAPSTAIGFIPRGGSDPITIGLDFVRRDKQLDVPVRPGDVILVPAAGEVMVQGWVQTPGAYKITPGMTALAAITAAGGAMFSSSASVLRTGDSGGKVAYSLDLSKIQNGQDADLPVESGDIVVVQRSVLGAAPYAFYEIFTHFGTGLVMSGAAL